MELEEDNFKLAESVRLLKADIQEKDELVLQAETEKEDIEKDLKNLQKKIKEMEQDKIVRGRKQIEVAGQLETMRSEHELLLADFKELSSSSTQLQTEYDSLLEQHNTVNQNKLNLMNSNEELSAHCEKLNEELKAAKSNQSRLEDELDTFKGKQLQRDSKVGTNISKLLTRQYNV